MNEYKIEVWKPIKGYEGLYDISNLGRVKSLPRLRQYKYDNTEIIMKQNLSKGGYLRIKLLKNGEPKMHLVHRLVAEAFIPNPNNLPQINHKDENKTNNFVYVNPDGTVDLEKSNLEWCTSKYNINYGNRKQKVRTKALNGMLSKKVLQYSIEGELIAEYPSINEAARQTKIKLSNISFCCNKKEHYKTAGGYVWKFKEVA